MSFLIDKLIAIVNEHNLNGIGNGSRQITQELCSVHFTCLSV